MSTEPYVIDSRRAIACLEEALEFARALHGFKLEDLPDSRPHAARVARRHAAATSRRDLLRAANLASLAAALLEAEEHHRHGYPNPLRTSLEPDDA